MIPTITESCCFHITLVFLIKEVISVFKDSESCKTKATEAQNTNRTCQIDGAS